MYSLQEIEKQKSKDEILVRERWDALEEKIRSLSDADTARRIRASFENYYSELLCDGDLISWVGNLYDYESGGFYYSNSGRDNDGFLPDLESTYQAMNWIFNNTLKDDTVETKADFYPGWVKERLIKFVKEKQDKNGYFYHPQWPRELTDSKPHRRGRDLNWACNLLSDYGSAPTYDTPSGVRGDGLLWDGSAVEGFSHRDDVEVVAPKEDLVTPQLKDKEAFIEYLEGFDLKTSSYPVSNTLEAQAAQILIRDEVLREKGADYSLADILVDWFAKNQDPRTGLFTFEDPDCEGLNGLMKASSTVFKLNRPFPNPIPALESSIAVVEGEEAVYSVCYVMNPLCTINGLFSNIKKFSDESAIGKYRARIFAEAPEIIRKTKERILTFKKPDGSFSFCPEYSSHTSQGHPVAIEKTYEGDVNATMIATSPVIGHLCEILGVPKMPLFTMSDRMRLLNIMEEKMLMSKGG